MITLAVPVTDSACAARRSALHILTGLWLAGAIVSTPNVGRAQSAIPQPSMGLGTFSFLDGDGGPGFTFETVGSGYQAWRLNDTQGGKVPGRNQQTIAGINIHPIYVSELKLLGGNLGFDAVIPLVYLHNDFAGSDSTNTSVGDVTFDPQIQWSQLSLLGRPFSMRFGLQIVAPTGSYNRDRPSNVGQNIWQISPYYAFTWRTTELWEVSGRLIYDWSGENRDLARSSGTRSAQPGQQAAFSLSASYALSDQWRAGITGYGFQQITNTEIDGTALPGSRQRAFGIGPGLVWSSSSAKVIANVFKEFGVENRPQGYQAVLRLITPF
ncbi:MULTISPECIES: transporter [unclassified Bradyrhizobium]|uniref:SphA family protein n=1 Tax=unclassified Bradyrhizobium TaxID=2631580 RepID=UPI0024794270|nr:MULTISPECIES: transporter [unclassified Bradyrhizobium]WGR73137.1 transporter [Bradyrhizobium sp. ISRA426]WGR77977.1 transporter [Bradyrhizobium sp. ISRA430]WGR88378.1 transporter [Bradyrhizobium sp. ISRA432]